MIFRLTGYLWAASWAFQAKSLRLACATFWHNGLLSGVKLHECLLRRFFPDQKQGSGPRYGLGVLIEEKEPFGERWGHGGVIPGYSSSMRYYPKYGVAIAFQINTDEGISDYAHEIEHRLAEIITNARS